MAALQPFLILVFCFVFQAVQVDCQQWKGDKAPLLKQLQRLEKMLAKISKLDGFVGTSKHSAQLHKEANCGSKKFDDMTSCSKEYANVMKAFSNYDSKCSKDAGVNAKAVTSYFINEAQPGIKLDFSDANSGVSKSFGRHMRYVECIYQDSKVMLGTRVDYNALTKAIVKSVSPSSMMPMTTAVKNCATLVGKLMESLPQKLTPPDIKKPVLLEPLLAQQCLFYQILTTFEGGSTACSDQKSTLQGCNPFTS